MAPREPVEPPDRPEDLLDAIECAASWSEEERRAYFDRWVGRFSAETWRSCVRSRLDRLNSPAAEAILRVIEVHGDDDLFNALVETLRTREDLPPERVWEALDVLDGAGKLEDHADLAERRDEVEGWLETEEEIVAELVDTLETDEDGPEIVARALENVEPEVRRDVLENLARRASIGPARERSSRCFHAPKTLAPRDRRSNHRSTRSSSAINARAKSDRLACDRDRW